MRRQELQSRLILTDGRRDPAIGEASQLFRRARRLRSVDRCANDAADVRPYALSPFPSKMKLMRCPTCEKEFKEVTKSMPFCCERCRQIDLGAWLGEERAMPVDIDKRLAQLSGEIPEEDDE